MMTSAFVLLVLVGCADQPKEQDASIPVAEETSFETIPETLQDGNLTIEYPQLSPVQDGAVEQQINEVIKEDVSLFMNDYKDPDASLNMDYKIMLQNDEILSIVYTGDYSFTGGMYPSHFLFTTNIDMKTGEKIKLTDRFVIDEAFIDSFKQSPYIDREENQSNYMEKKAAVTEYVFRQDLLEAFKNADQPSFVKNLYGVYTYYTEDALIISIQVPHVLGDHAEFKLSLEGA